jgi:hypothetical protein
MPAFIPGRELSRRFYAEAVRPILDGAYPGLPHAAGHLGAGSDVLGFDTEMSRDHDWGPACTLVLREHDAALAEPIVELMAARLPREFLGYPAGFIDSPAEPGTDVAAPPDYAGPLRHRVRPTTLARLTRDLLGWASAGPLEPADWLATPAQLLRCLVTAAVHHDGVGELSALRARLAWYPPDVWRYLLACGWERLGQEDHLLSRAGFVGDELGSAIMGSRLARDIMSLCFLIERSYAPYPKWFGSAFSQLECAAELEPILWRIQLAQTWPEREAALCEAGVALARMHNALGLTEPLAEQPEQFFSRPFRVIGAGRFTEALLSGVTDPAVVGLARRPLIGSIDQFSDSTDLRSGPGWFPLVRRLYLE